jgi:hypothetical protein
VQTRLAEAEAILNAARAYVVGSVGASWEEVCAGASDPSLAIAQARLAIVHAMHEASVRTRRSQGKRQITVNRSRGTGP